MRSLILSLIALLALVLFVTPASACVNDREVIQAEKEFKSRYIEKAPQPAPEYEPAPSTPSHLLAMGGGGVILLAGAVLVGLVRTGKP